MYLLSISLISFTLSFFEFISLIMNERKNDFDILVLWGIFCVTLLLFLIKKDRLSWLSQTTSGQAHRIKRRKLFLFLLERSPSYIGMFFVFLVSFGFLFRLLSDTRGMIMTSMGSVLLLFLLGIGPIIKHLYFSK